MWNHIWILLFIYFVGINASCPNSLDMTKTEMYSSTLWTTPVCRAEYLNTTCILPFSTSNSTSQFLPMNRTCQHIPTKSSPALCQQYYLTEKRHEDSILNTVKNFAYYGSERVRLGMFVSRVNGPAYKIFHVDYENIDCNSPSAYICSSTANEEQCQALGCCFDPKGNRCTYPAKQKVVTFTPSPKRMKIDIPAGDHQRYCAELVRENTSTPTTNNWIWKSYECFRNESGNVTTLYACECQCGSSWPQELWDDEEFGNATTTTATTPTTKSTSATKTTPSLKGQPPTTAAAVTSTNHSPNTTNCSLNCSKTAQSDKKTGTIGAAVGGVVGTAAVMGVGFGVWKYFHRHSSVATDGTPRNTRFNKSKLPKTDPVQEFHPGMSDPV